MGFTNDLYLARRVLRRYFCSVFVLTLSPATSLAEDWIYTVCPGDNLWDISQTHLKSPMFAFTLQTLNGIPDPTHILPGTRIRIPLTWIKKQPYKAVIINVQGEAEKISASGTEPIRLETGMHLSAGDSIRTGSNGIVLIELIDRSQLYIAPGSKIDLGTLDRYGESGVLRTKIGVDAGGVESRVTKIRQPSTRFEIRTPAAITSVRGTEYRVGIEDATHASRIEVLAGEVLVTGTRGGTAKLTSGLGTWAEVDRAPHAPSKLLPPPELENLPTLFDRVPIEVTLPEALKKERWRAQILAVDDSERFVFDYLGTGRRIHGPDIPDGRYVLRVRTIAENGLEGLHTDHAFTLKAHPVPPVLVDPPQGAAVSQNDLTFAWTKNEQATTYQFQLAKTPEFQSLVVDLADAPDTRIMLDSPLTPGIYYWRVASKNTTEGIGPFSDPQQFRLPPQAPHVESPLVLDDQITFRWRKGEPGQQYEFQFTRDANFSDPIAQAVVTEPQTSVTRPNPGRYYVRVRIIDSDGYQGPYSKPQSIEIESSKPSWLPLLFLAPLLL